ncbi:MAG TPA: SGNH/GDSL hydrolase family protein [Ktedonobacteraceae bacterium]|jgi:lysophospholipase L1-like esterase|nr:SGNH/GDSL hydrolase family protein [Ktedonobacteraceae bacterium]
MRLQKKEKFVMIGDSITDCGRTVAGEGTRDDTGRGYVAQVEALLNVVYPDLSIRVVNRGIGGNTVRDLKARWQRDVLDLQADWLSIMIGTNDVWRQFDHPLMPELHVYEEEYERTLRELVEQTRPQVKGLILMTPFYLEANRADLMRAKMDIYGNIVKSIAESYDTIFVDTQAAFDNLLEYTYTSTLSGDRVHPNQVGHMVITRALLNALDFSW